MRWLKMLNFKGPLLFQSSDCEKEAKAMQDATPKSASNKPSGRIPVENAFSSLLNEMKYSKPSRLRPKYTTKHQKHKSHTSSRKITKDGFQANTKTNKMYIKEKYNPTLFQSHVSGGLLY